MIAPGTRKILPEVAGSLLPPLARLSFAGHALLMRAPTSFNDDAETPPESEAQRPSVTLAVRPDRIIADPKHVRWETVTLSNAPLAALARFAAWHLELGAERIHLYLDAAAPQNADFLSQNPAVSVTTCTEEWWQSIGRARPPAHQNRQSIAASQAYRATSGQWLCHLDTDEFLLPDSSVAEWLANAPDDLAVINVAPAELLAPLSAGGPAQFKLSPRFAGQSSEVRERLYPTFAPYLRGGYISHLEGKNFVRTGYKSMRIGIHACHFQQNPIRNRGRVPGLWLGHAHAPTWDAFKGHLNFRRTKGSYRPQKSGNIGLAQILDVFAAEDGPEAREAALRLLFEEVCTARPDLIAALMHYGMLIERDMPLDTLVMRHFGHLPDPQP